MTDASEIVRGSINLHAHGYPEVTLGFGGPGGMGSCIEWAEDAREAGMAGFVIKSHTVPSVTLAHAVDAAVDGVDVYGSATLNPPAGGMDPLSAEIAARLGAAVVYMPTWSARYDLDVGGASTHIPVHYENFDLESFEGIDPLDDDGDLRPSAVSVLDELADHGVAVGTGHVGPDAALAIAERIADRVPVVFDHPTSSSTNATVEGAREIADAGAFVEFVALGTVGRFRRITHGDLADWIRAVGVDRCLLSTDAYSTDSPSPPALMRECLEGLLEAGLSEAELEVLVKDNPRRVVADRAASPI